MAWAPDGRWVATGTYDGGVRVRDGRTSAAGALHGIPVGRGTELAAASAV